MTDEMALRAWARTWALELCLRDLRLELLGKGLIKPLTQARVQELTTLIKADLVAVGNDEGLPPEIIRHLIDLTVASYERAQNDFLGTDQSRSSR